MEMKEMFSQNVIAKLIQKHEGSKYSSSDIYNQLREMVESKILANEGVEVRFQKTEQGSYGKVYSFDNCQKVVEIWAQLYGKSDENEGDILLGEIKALGDKNKQFRSFIPNRVWHRILKHLSDKNK